MFNNGKNTQSHIKVAGGGRTLSVCESEDRTVCSGQANVSFTYLKALPTDVSVFPLHETLFVRCA